MDLKWALISSAIIALLLCVLCGQTDATADEGTILYDYIAFNLHGFDNSTWNTTNSNPDPCTSSWKYVTCSSGNVVRLDLSDLNVTGTLNFEVGKLSSLQTLDLGGNQISGGIPSSLGNLTALKVLNLSSNIFSGSIPSTLANLTSLITFSLANNNLSGAIPDDLLGFCTSGAFLGNPLLTTVCPILSPPPPFPPPSTSPSPPIASSSGGGSSSSGAVIGGVVGGVIFFLVLLCLVFLWLRRKRKRGGKERLPLFAARNETDMEFLSHVKKFDLAELLEATDGFNKSTRLGEGGFSVVHKGVLRSGKTVAIKRLKEKVLLRGDAFFIDELAVISRTLHRNLLKLEGYCMEEEERLMVFPLMQLGSVAAHLRGGALPPIPFEKRPMIALEAATGLAYMHNECNPPVLHGDVKADNILLDSDFRPVVADFGLARNFASEETRERPQDLRGTFGYIAPEYHMTGQVSEKTDVFAFGVFLLELALGRRISDIVEDPTAANISLLEWVSKLLLENQIRSVIDQSIHISDLDLGKMEEICQIAALCMLDQPEERLTMRNCVSFFKGEGLEQRWVEWQNRFSTSDFSETGDSGIELRVDSWTTGGTGGTNSIGSNFGMTGEYAVELSGPR